jgi:hypothetical protein
MTRLVPTVLAGLFAVASVRAQPLPSLDLARVHSPP